MFILLTYTDFGLYAVVGTTTVLGFITFFVFTPLYSAWCIGLPLTAFYGAIIRIVFSDLVVVSTVKLIFKETVANSWMSFIGNVILIGIIGLFIYLICVFDKSERSRILALVKKELHK